MRLTTNHTKTNRQLWPLTILMIALSGFMFFSLSGCGQGNGGAQQARTAPEVGTVTIEAQAVELTSELPGRTNAYLMAEIRPQVNGIILERAFQEGSIVKAGQLLYQIDPAPFKAAYNSAKASLGKAEANLPSIRSRADRYKELLADKAVSQQDYDDAAAAVNQVLSEIQYWQATVETARINLAYTRVTAPISGYIGKSNVTDGAMVTAYQPMAMATIQQLDPIYVDVTQSSAELLRLNRSLGSNRLSTDEEDTKKVRIFLEDGTVYPLEGALQFRDVTVNPTTGSYTLRIVVPNPDLLLLPGMFVRAIISEGIINDAILAPQQGVSRNPKGEAVALIADETDTVQQRILKLDRAIGDKWLVSEGLAPGDRLIVEGLLSIRPGATVRVSPIDDSAANEPAQSAPQDQAQEPAPESATDNAPETSPDNAASAKTDDGGK